MVLRMFRWVVLLWEGVVGEFEWQLHMCVAQRKGRDVVQVNDDQTPT